MARITLFQAQALPEQPEKTAYLSAVQAMLTQCSLDFVREVARLLPRYCQQFPEVRRPPFAQPSDPHPKFDPALRRACYQPRLPSD